VLTVAEAAKRMELSEHTVRAYIERGLIKARKLGQMWLITAAECDRYLRERRPRGNPNLVKSA
jgi:excisionase family DNA binding protein